jgi:hypothetical protein
MEQNQPEDEELRRFRAEAAELLGLTPSADRRGQNLRVAEAMPSGPEAFAQP